MLMLAPEQKMRSRWRADHHGADLGMLEAQALHGIGQLDVDAEIVGIELQLVAGLEPAILVHVHGEVGDAVLEC